MKRATRYAYLPLVILGLTVQAAKLLGQLGTRPNLTAYVARRHARSAYPRAIERGPSMLDV